MNKSVFLKYYKNDTLKQVLLTSTSEEVLTKEI